MKENKLTEKEIDEIVIAEADDERAWIEVLRKLGERGSREKFLNVLKKVPQVEPDEENKLE